MKIKYISLLIASALTANAQTLIGFEDFDGGEINLSSTSNVYTVGTEPGITSPADAFGITDNVTIGGPFSFWDATVLDTAAVGNFPSDVLGLGGINTTAFWGMDDPDGGSDVVANNNATWSFDFGTPESLQSIQIDIAAMGDYEAGDGFIIEAQLDGGGYQTIFQGITNEDIDHTYRLFDDGVTAPTLPDPLEIYIDGSGTAAGILDKADSATGDFDTYTSILFSGQSATTVDVRIRWDGTTSGGEPMGFDNISIFAGAAVPTLVVTETDGSTDVTEGGATDSIEFVLTTTPSANVDVTLTPDTELDLGNGAGNPVVLNFTPGDATTAQFATVTAFDDAVLEGLHSGTISVLTASTDGDYDALSDTINVSITDNDSAAAGDLIITQYYEGNSNDRYIELTNVGNTSIDVTGYVITRWSNENNEDYKTAGGTPAGTLDLTPLGTLAAGQSVILANGDASTPIRAIDADLTQTFAEGGALSFNGDDSVVLYASSTIDPSNIVDAIGFTGANEGANVSFVRAAQLQGYNLVAGSNATSFPSVWTSVPVSTADGASLGDDAFLGSTSLVTLTTVSFVQGSLTVAEDDGSFDIDVAMSGLTSGSVSVDVTFDSGSSTADASDFTFTSPSPLTFTVDGTQTINVPIVDDGLDGSTEVASFTLSITSGTASLFTSTFDVSIQDSDIVIPDLIISEIADPSDDFNARFVEIYNPTGSPVDLGAGNWNLVRFSNGAALGTGVDIPLTGEISAGGTYVIAFTDISGPYHTAAYGTTADQESSNINGNGDDVYALFIEGDDDDGGTLVDVYGVIGIDGSGEAWEYADSRAVRNAEVTEPNTIWTASEWTIASAAVADMTPGVHPDSDIDAPTGVSAAATGEGEITIDFTPDGGNDVVVIFNTTGTFSAPSGTPLIGQALAGGTVLYVGQSSPYIHTGLDAETEYFYSVYTYIDPDYSNAVPVSATTPVAGLLNIEDFEDPGGDTDDWFNAAVSSDDAFEIVTSTGTNSAQIDGSLNPNPDNQYLVSPLLDFSTKSNGVISFEFVGGYDDSDPDSFELVYSTNYSGSGDPESSATWTEIPFDFSTNLEAGDPIALAASGNVSLPPALDGESTVYLAFRYTSDGTLTGSERWLLDNILVTADSASDPLGDYLAARSLVPGDLETDVNTNGFTVLEEYLAGFDDGETFSYGVNPGAGSAGAFTLTSDSASIPDGITVVLRVTNDLLVAPVSTDYTINVTGPDSNGDFTIEFIETYVEGVSPSLTGQRFFFLDITQN